MDRKTVNLIKTDGDRDDAYIEAEKNELISMIWEITKDNWAFVTGQDVKRRLQRDVTTLVRRES